MDRINEMLNHHLFNQHLKMNMAAEAGRRFCRHDMAHFLDVARIGMIMNTEEGLGLSRDLIYGAALLHDLGKHRQYEEGIPHEEASARIAPGILRDCGFDDNETAVITDAIRQHRNRETAAERNLRGLLYRADKASRPCFFCEAEQECTWESRKKNRCIVY